MNKHFHIKFNIFKKLYILYKIIEITDKLAQEHCMHNFYSSIFIV